MEKDDETTAIDNFEKAWQKYVYYAVANNLGGLTEVLPIAN